MAFIKRLANQPVVEEEPSLLLDGFVLDKQEGLLKRIRERFYPGVGEIEFFQNGKKSGTDNNYQQHYPVFKDNKMMLFVVQLITDSKNKQTKIIMTDLNLNILRVFAKFDINFNDEDIITEVLPDFIGSINFSKKGFIYLLTKESNILYVTTLGNPFVIDDNENGNLLFVKKEPVQAGDPDDQGVKLYTNFTDYDYGEILVDDVTENFSIVQYKYDSTKAQPLVFIHCDFAKGYLKTSSGSVQKTNNSITEPTIASFKLKNDEILVFVSTKGGAVYKADRRKETLTSNTLGGGLSITGGMFDREGVKCSTHEINYNYFGPVESTPIQPPAVRYAQIRDEILQTLTDDRRFLFKIYDLQVLQSFTKLSGYFPDGTSEPYTLKLEGYLITGIGKKLDQQDGFAEYQFLEQIGKTESQINSQYIKDDWFQNGAVGPDIYNTPWTNFSKNGINTNDKILNPFSQPFDIANNEFLIGFYFKNFSEELVDYAPYKDPYTPQGTVGISNSSQPVYGLILDYQIGVLDRTDSSVTFAFGAKKGTDDIPIDYTKNGDELVSNNSNFIGGTNNDVLQINFLSMRSFLIIFALHNEHNAYTFSYTDASTPPIVSQLQFAQPTLTSGFNECYIIAPSTDTSPLFVAYKNNLSVDVVVWYDPKNTGDNFINCETNSIVLANNKVDLTFFTASTVSGLSETLYIISDVLSDQLFVDDVFVNILYNTTPGVYFNKIYKSSLKELLIQNINLINNNASVSSKLTQTIVNNNTFIYSANFKTDELFIKPITSVGLITENNLVFNTSNLNLTKFIFENLYLTYAIAYTNNFVDKDKIIAEMKQIVTTRSLKDDEGINLLACINNIKITTPTMINSLSLDGTKIDDHTYTAKFDGENTKG